jgi:dienelactone hydrolase
MRALAGLGAMSCVAACAAPPWSVSNGIATRQLTVEARGIEGVDVLVVAPEAAEQGGAAERTGIVLAPGGFVAASSYSGIARDLAARGYAVAIPSFPLELGFFTPDNIYVARDLLLNGDVPSHTPALATRQLVISGHSLGGVDAATAAIHGGFAALLLFAGEASPTDDAEGLRIPVLSLSGDHDCSLPNAQAKVAFERFRSAGSLFGTIQGFSHYGFTDSLTPDGSPNCTGDLGLDAGHALVAELVDLFLQSRLEGSASAAAQLTTGIPGVTFETIP